MLRQLVLKERERQKKRARGAEQGGHFWLMSFLHKQAGRGLVTPFHPPQAKSHLSGIRPMDRRMERRRDRRRKAVIRYAQDKVLTKSHVACWAGIGRRNLSSVPHLSIDIPVSPSPASGFCNYHQTAASRPPKHWLTARINRDVERPFDAVCLFIYAALLSMCSMFWCQILMCVCVSSCLSGDLGCIFMPTQY